MFTACDVLSIAHCAQCTASTSRDAPAGGRCVLCQEGFILNSDASQCIDNTMYPYCDRVSSEEGTLLFRWGIGSVVVSLILCMMMRLLIFP